MNRWRLLAFFVASASTGAEAGLPARMAYSCEDPPITKIVVHDDFRSRFHEFSDTRDLAERRKLADRLGALAQTPTEREWAKLANAMVLTDDRKYAEAGQLYEEIATSRAVGRNLSDLARVALSKLAMQREDYDGALAWLEPMVAAQCKTVEDSARRFLAYLYQEKGRLKEALEQVDKVSLRGDADADHWRAVRIDFRCTLEGDTGCIRQIGSLARAGELGTEALASANRNLARMRASQSGQAALASATAFGVLDERGEIVVSKVEPVVPVKRATPRYPRDALERGITGYVDVALVINPDGSVQSAEVWDARPMEVFDRVALIAARRSTFKPRIVDGQPVESRGLQRYHFVIGPP